MSCDKQKTVNEVLDYEEDWSTVLTLVTPNDTIQTSVWTVDSGLVIDSQSNTDTVSKIWASVGLLGEKARMTIKITTAGGRTHERTVVVEIIPPHKY